jgi:hypothetical protein
MFLDIREVAPGPQTPNKSVEGRKEKENKK